MIKYKCAYCDKEAEYDPKDAVLLRDRQESQQTGKDVFYHVMRCNHCGARNQRKPPKDTPGAGPS